MDKKRFRQQAIDDFSRIVRDYPANPKIVAAAKRHLTDLEAPIPETNPEALALLKYNQEHYVKPSIVHRELSTFITGTPDTSHASKKGEPTMTAMRSSIPVSVPVVVDTSNANGSGGTGSGVNEVNVQQLKGDSKLDEAPDARKAAATGVAAAAANSNTAATNAPPPSNHAKDIAAAQAEQQKRAKKNKKKNTTQPPAAPATDAQPTATPTAGQPASTGPTTTPPTTPASPNPPQPQR
jgi:hypothetical protein